MTRHRAARIGGLLLSVACLAFLAHAARDLLAVEGFSLADSAMLRSLPAAMVPFLLAYAALAWAWYSLVRLFRIEAPAARVVGIYLTTQIAKYLPGNVGHHIGRVYLSSREGMPAFRVGLGMIVEMSMIMAVAAIFSLPLAPLVVERLADGGRWGGTSLAVAILLAVLCVLAGIAFMRHPAFERLRLHAATLVRELRHGAPRFLPVALLLSIAGLALAGCSLVVLCATVTGLTSDLAIHGIALVSAAWVIGFLAPGAPAGLGVREAVLLVGLESLVGRAAAFEAAIVFRLLSVAADLVAFIAGYGLLRLSRTRPPSTEVAP